MPVTHPTQTSSRPPLLPRSARRLVPVIYLASFLLFIFDLFRVDVLAFGLFYTPMVATAVFHKARYSVWILSALAIAMVIIGIFVPTMAPNHSDLIGNRMLSILAIIATAVFIQYARDTQDRLAEQTRRIEAAERMKSEVLANLSQEMRPPLHGLLSILSLMTATCRPDQRASLGKVRGGTQHLLQNINNIIDLTELDDRQLEARPIDLRTVGQQVVDQVQAAARERQITIDSPENGEPVLAQADSWATRRIMENLLTHAILATQAGGLVSLILDRGPGIVTATVSGSIPGAQAVGARDLAAETDGSPSDALATGLILVRRLAGAIGGEMAALDHSDSRMILRLSLPAAVG